jgi:hypothetical protein
LLTGDEGTTWIAVGAAVLAVLAFASALVLAVRLRNTHRILRDAGQWPPAEQAVSDLTQALERAQGEAARAHEESARARKESEQARNELRWLRDLNAIGTTLDLEPVLERALEVATRLGNGTAAMVVLEREDEEPLVATFGLSATESSRDLLGLPPEGGDARA